MAVRYTCRLILVPSSSAPDTFRLRYGYLGDGAGCLTAIGPEMVHPPADLELSALEWKRWLTARGWTLALAKTAHTAPLVEATRTVEDLIPSGAVSARLFWADTSEGRTLGVEVCSTWGEMIPDVSLAACYRNEAPQPLGIRAQLPGGRSHAFFHLNGGARAVALIGPRSGAAFALDPDALPALRSRAAALSPESHWLAILTGGHEFHRVPGDVVAQFLNDDE